MLYRLLSFVCALAILAGCGRENSPLASSEMGEDQEAIAKLAVSEAVAGTCEKCGQDKMTAFPNTAMVGGNEYNPTAVVGATHVKVASIVVQVDAKEAYRLRHLNVTSDLPAGVFGQVFHNLKVFVRDIQVGSTAGTLSDETVAFQFGSTVPVEPMPAYVIIDFYADIYSSATAEDLAAVNNHANGPFAISAVDGFGVVSRHYAQSQGSINGQRVFIATQGSLNITPVAASSQVPTQIVTAGIEEVELFRFKLGAVLEDVDVTRFVISHQVIAAGVATDHGQPFSTLYNFKLYDGTTLVAGPIPLTFPSVTGNGGYIDFTIGSDAPYRVNAGTEKMLTLKALVASAQSISSGSTHRFSLTGDAFGDGSNKRAITARGVTTALNLDGPEPGTEIVGNETTVRGSYPLIERMDLGSTALAAGATSQKQIAVFKVTAVGDEVDLRGLTFNVAVTDATPSVPLEVSNFKLFSNGTVVHEYSVVINGSQIMIVFTPLGMDGEVIAAGQSNTYELKADIANAHMGSSTDSDSIAITLVDESTGLAYNLPLDPWVVSK